MHGLPCFRSILEQLFSRPCVAFFIVPDLVFCRSELHFAKIYDAIVPVDKEIHLGAIVFGRPRNLP